jgi:Na+-transporting NADH:ubiquinone oxidoreductase subunit C
VDRESNVYTIGYALVLTVIVAVVLTSMVTGLKELQRKNELLATKQDILKAVGLKDLPKDSVEIVFDARVEGLVLTSSMQISSDTTEAVAIDLHKEVKLPAEEQRYPLYVYDAGDSKQYIVPMYGKGLWDKIWGYVALEDDFNTIAGISMDHKGETPALGAEIKDNPKMYNDPYVGKKMYNEDGEYVSVMMKKGVLNDPDHQIAGITGATITSNGVNAMLLEDVKSYEPYFDALKNAR